MATTQAPTTKSPTTTSITAYNVSKPKPMRTHLRLVHHGPLSLSPPLQLDRAEGRKLDRNSGFWTVFPFVSGEDWDLVGRRGVGGRRCRLWALHNALVSLNLSCRGFWRGGRFQVCRFDGDSALWIVVLLSRREVVIAGDRENKGLVIAGEASRVAMKAGGERWRLLYIVSTTKTSSSSCPHSFTARGFPIVVRLQAPTTSEQSFTIVRRE